MAIAAYERSPTPMAMTAKKAKRRTFTSVAAQFAVIRPFTSE